MVKKVSKNIYFCLLNFNLCLKKRVAPFLLVGLCFSTTTYAALDLVGLDENSQIYFFSIGNEMRPQLEYSIDSKPFLKSRGETKVMDFVIDKANEQIFILARQTIVVKKVDAAGLFSDKTKVTTFFRLKQSFTGEAFQRASVGRLNKRTVLVAHTQRRIFVFFEINTSPKEVSMSTAAKPNELKPVIILKTDSKAEVIFSEINKNNDNLGIVYIYRNSEKDIVLNHVHSFSTTRRLGKVHMTKRKGFEFKVLGNVYIDVNNLLMMDMDELQVNKNGEFDDFVMVFNRNQKGIFSLASGRQNIFLDEHPRVRENDNKNILSMATSKDGNILAVHLQDSRIAIWERFSSNLTSNIFYPDNRLIIKTYMIGPCYMFFHELDPTKSRGNTAQVRPVHLVAVDKNFDYYAYKVGPNVIRPDISAKNISSRKSKLRIIKMN